MEIVGVRPLLPSEGSNAPCTRFSVPCGMKRVHGHKDFTPAGSLVGRARAADPFLKMNGRVPTIQVRPPMALRACRDRAPPKEVPVYGPSPSQSSGKARAPGTSPRGPGRTLNAVAESSEQNKGSSGPNEVSSGPNEGAAGAEAAVARP